MSAFRFLFFCFSCLKTLLRIWSAYELTKRSYADKGKSDILINIKTVMGESELGRKMRKIELGKDIECVLLITLLISICGGGYFISISAILNIILLVSMLIYLWKNKKINISKDVNMLALSVLILGYLCSTFWAVDQGMALMGSVKFLPLFLYYLLLCQKVERREEIIQLLPVVGTLMTIFSFVMMQFSAFEKLVTVAGRLAGFFQYPNTYALFLLICMVVTVYRINLKKIDWLDMIHIMVALLGIVMSGSRTVFVMMGGVVLFLCIRRAELRKIGLLCLSVVALIIKIGLLSGFANEIMLRFTSISLTSSTLLGRLLYSKDALALIVQHPFGLGYYGYYFMQQQIQTGVYSVTNVHNEFFQIMLDVGIIAALLFYGAMIKSIVSKTNKGRNRVILLVLMLHSFVDYDFQFLIIGFIMLLFLDITNLKEIRTANVTGVICGGLAGGALCVSICIGMSEILYMANHCEQAVFCYGGNTMAKTELLLNAEESEEMEEIADDILKSNKQSAVAYSAKARATLSHGDVEGFVKYKLRTIQLAPYQYEEYVDYLESLAFCYSKYYEAGDMEGAKFCAKRADAIPKMLEEVKERTSWLGWKIKDVPKVVLSHENMELIEEMKEETGE